MTIPSSKLEAVRKERGTLCIGIDPSTSILAAWGLPDTADGALELGRVVIEAAASRVGIVKPQVAFFERFGARGFAALESVIARARRSGLAVIADAKRGDIGTTMSGYGEAWLGEGPLGSEGVTMSPYLGFTTLEPAFTHAEARGATVFVLCATSNPDAPSVQAAQRNGRTVAATIAHAARARNRDSHTVGLVVGATRSLTDSGLSADDLEDALILAPGFGAQGARLSDIKSVFGAVSEFVIPSVSRSVLDGGHQRVAVNIDAHLRELNV